MHKKTNLLLPFFLSAAMVVTPVLSSVPVMADDTQEEQTVVTEQEPEAEAEESSSNEDETEETTTHSISVSAVMRDTGAASGMYAMEDAIVTEQADGTYLVRMHQSAVNRNMMALTDDKDKATNHEVDWYKAGGADGYWFVIPVQSLDQPLDACLSSETRIADGKEFGNIVTYTFDTTSMADTDEAEVTSSEMNVLPAESVEPETVIQNLTASSTTAMFKAVSGYVETTDGHSVLHVALSGTGCQDLYPGTYDQAVASTDADPVDTSNWIHYTVNSDGKYEFAIPIEEGQTYVPVVSLSGKYYTQGSKIWYPRQFVIDYENSTLVSGDYDFSESMTLTNENPEFTAVSAELETIGGPISNNYKQIVKLNMSDAAYDQAYIGTAAEAQAAASVIALDENNTFAFAVKANKQGGTIDYDYTEQPLIVSFYNAQTDSWVEGIMTVSTVNGSVNLNAGTFVITSQPENAAARKGSTASFTVKAVNAASYQWYYQKAGTEKWSALKDNTTSGSEISGASENTLSLTATKTRMTFSYRCKVTAADGTVVYTDTAVFDSAAVVITEQPQSVQTEKGSEAVLSVKAENAASYSWQYTLDGTTWKTLKDKTAEASLISGASSDTLTIKATATRQKMSFRCKIKGMDGSVVYTDTAAIG